MDARCDTDSSLAAGDIEQSRDGRVYPRPAGGSHYHGISQAHSGATSDLSLSVGHKAEKRPTQAVGCCARQPGRKLRLRDSPASRHPVGVQTANRTRSSEERSDSAYQAAVVPERKNERK